MTNTELQRIIGYTVPMLHTGKDWYIVFSAYDPVLKKMRRKTIRLNHVKPERLRKEYAGDLIERLIVQLRAGWNPWIDRETGREYAMFGDVLAEYKKVLDKYLIDGYIREETYLGYASYHRNLLRYNESLKPPIRYVYQFDRAYISEFLDHVYIDRGNRSHTRDNYLVWLRVFSGWLVTRAYLKSKPTDGIEILGRRSRKKERDVIPQETLRDINRYLVRTNRHYLLACYVLFYCFIRPKEMTFIRIRDISLARKTITLYPNQTKNGKRATITIPDKVIYLMLDLGIFSHPGEWYLFSTGFAPGAEQASDKNFRDFWGRKLRPALRLPGKLKFYSLKDTGVTLMLKNHVDTLSVRDQARHSSILITDTYTPHDIEQANPIIAKFDTDF